MKNILMKKEQRVRRRNRIRAKISGTSVCPRLAVFKSNRFISAQLIDDTLGKTICASHSKTLKGKNLMEKSMAVGKDIASQASAKKIATVVFDRGGFSYTGAIKAVAEGAREGGLKF